MSDNKYINYYDNFSEYDINSSDEEIKNKSTSKLKEILRDMSSVREKTVEYNKKRIKFRDILFEAINCMTSRKKITINKEITIKEDDIFIYHKQDKARLENVLSSKRILSEIQEFIKDDELTKKLSKTREEFIEMNSPEVGLRKRVQMFPTVYIVEEVNRHPILIESGTSGGFLKFRKYRENHYAFQIINKHRYKENKKKHKNYTNKREYNEEITFRPGKNDLAILAEEYEYFQEIIDIADEKLEKRINFYDNQISKIRERFKREIVSSNIL